MPSRGLGLRKKAQSFSRLPDRRPPWPVIPGPPFISSRPPASVADEGRREEPLAGADLVVLALQEALVAVPAPLVHAAVRVADLRPLAVPVPPARRVRGLEALGRIDAPRLDLVGDGLRGPTDLRSRGWRGRGEARPRCCSCRRWSSAPCRFSFRESGVPARTPCPRRSRKEQSTEFEKVNVGLPLGEDMEKELSGVSIENKKNQCPL